MIDRDAVLVGWVLEVALLVTFGAIDTEFFRALPWLGAVLLTSVGLAGGAAAGGLVGGSRRTRAIHGGLCGSLGGCVFAIWLYYTLVADVYLGAFYGVVYVVATIGIPSALAAQYDALVPIAIGVVVVVCYAIEGVLAGWLVPPEWVEAPPWYPS